MKKFLYPLLLTVLTIVGLAAVEMTDAKAEAVAKPGLYAEQRVEIDGFTVRRVVDTQTKLVCYLATNTMYVAARAGSISCVRP